MFTHQHYPGRVLFGATDIGEGDVVFKGCGAVVNHTFLYFSMKVSYLPFYSYFYFGSSL